MDQNSQNQILEELKRLAKSVASLREELRSQGARLSKLEEMRISIEPSRTAEEPFTPFEVVSPAPPASVPEPSSVPRPTMAPPEPPPYIPSGEAVRPVIPTRGDISGLVKGVTGWEAPQGINLEAMMGGNWLVKIGVAALVIGVGFFLKYAFDHWMGPTGQVATGVGVGLLLIGLGEFWKTRYANYAHAITGGGIAILYLSFYGAFAFYDPPVIVSAYATFFFVLLVTVASGALAVRYNSAVIALLGMAGGYLTPLMLYRDLPSNELMLIGYIVLLNFGVMGISAFRDWRPFTLVSFLGTHLLFFVWHGDAYAAEKLGLAMSALTAFFIQFVFVTVAYHLIDRKASQNPDVVLMGANAAVYFGWSYKLLRSDYEPWLGFFAVGLALFYFLFAYLAYLRNREDPRLTLTLAGVSLVFLTIAVPIQLRQYWITIAWATEALILSWLGFYLKSYHLRVFSLLIFLLVVMRLFGFDMMQRDNLKDYIPVFNKTFFVFVVSITAFYLASYLWWLGKEDIRLKEERYVMPVLLLTANFLTLWIFSHEISRYFDSRISDAQKEAGGITIYGKRQYDYAKINTLSFLKNLCVTLLWALYAFGLMLAGTAKKYAVVQKAGMALLVLVMAKFVFVDTFGQTRLTIAQNFSLSFIWLVYSIALVVTGIAIKYQPMRVLALAFLWIIVFKVFLFDTWRLAELYRIASYISLGVILLGTGYLYLRFQERIKEFLAE